MDVCSLPTMSCFLISVAKDFLTFLQSRAVELTLIHMLYIIYTTVPM
jgi:hypothetical protein